MFGRLPIWLNTFTPNTQNITFGNVGSTATVTGTSLNVSYPSSISSGNYLLLFARCSRSSGSTPPVITGPGGDWVLLDTSGTTLSSIGRSLAVFGKVATGSESGTETFTTDASGPLIGWMVRYSNNTGFWDVTATNASNNTSSTSFSATASGDPGFTEGDMAVLMMNSSATTASYSAQTISTTGVTFGSVNNRQNTGNGTMACDSLIISGTSSEPPNISATLSVAGAKMAVLIRLRESEAIPLYPTSIYGSRLKGWWYEQVSFPGGDFLWTAETGPDLTMTFGDPYNPTTSTTPAGKLSVVSIDGSPYSETSSIGATGNALQLSVAINVTSDTSGAFGIIQMLHTDFSFVIGMNIIYSGGGAQVEAYSSEDLFYVNISPGWHVITLDIDGSLVPKLYIDGVMSGTDSAWSSLNIASLTHLRCPAPVGNGGTVASPCVAFDSSDFTLVDAVYIADWLSYVVGNSFDPASYLP